MVTARAEETRAAPETTISKKRMLIDLVVEVLVIRLVLRVVVYVVMGRIKERVTWVERRRERVCGTGAEYIPHTRTNRPH